MSKKAAAEPYALENALRKHDIYKLKPYLNKLQELLNDGADITDVSNRGENLLDVLVSTVDSFQTYETVTEAIKDNSVKIAEFLMSNGVHPDADTIEHARREKLGFLADVFEAHAKEQADPKYKQVFSDADREFITRIFLGNRSRPAYLEIPKDRPGLLLTSQYLELGALRDKLKSHGIVAFPVVAKRNFNYYKELYIPFKDNPDLMDKFKRAFLRENIGYAIDTSGLKEQPDSLANALRDALEDMGITGHARGELLKKVGRGSREVE